MIGFRKAFSSAIRIGRNIARYQEAHSLPPLPYEYNALEPIICCEIMEIHHKKHHAAYVNGLNEAEGKMKTALEKSDFPTVISLANAMKFNGGGHINHSLFWENMSPSGGQASDELASAIAQDFGSCDEMKQRMSQLTVSIQGSGWGWLGYNPISKKLELATCANQDPLQPTTGLIPLLGIDVWEHAYYLQYKNVRADYVKNFWDIVNWKVVSERFANATKN